MSGDGAGDGFFAYDRLVSFVYIFNPLNNAEYTTKNSFELYHLRQEEPGTIYGGPALPALGHALSGGVASALSTALVYPIDTIVTRMQVQNSLKGEKETSSAAADANAEYKNVLDAATKIYKNEGGIKAFYNGVTPDVVKHIADSFLFFLAYQTVREQMLNRKSKVTKDLSVLQELSVGVIAGALSKAVTSPIQQIVTRQQTAALKDAREVGLSSASQSKKSIMEIASHIKNEKGIAGFWSGYSAQLILTLNPAITFAVDNVLRSLLPKNYKDKPTPASTFLIAALSKVIATTITYPVMLAKSRQQASRGPSSDSESDPSYHKVEATADAARQRSRQVIHQLSRLVEGQAALLRSLQHIYRHEGVAGLYSGLQGEWIKGFLQHGLTMTVKESVHHGIIQLYYILLKLTKKWPADLEQAKQTAVAVAREGEQRAENIGVTAVEGVKDIANRVPGHSVVQDAAQRAENVGVTVVEGAKDVANKVPGHSFVQDAGQRAENIGVTVIEGAKDLGKKATGQDD